MSCMADPGGEVKPTVTYSSISDTSSAHFVSQLQTFEPYNTAPGNEILGFSSKLVPTSSDQFYDQATNDTVLIFPDSNRLLAKSSSFPHSQGCHGLSLSLNSSDPAVWRFGHNNPNEQVPGMQLGHFQVRNSNYLGPAKELLAEFCSVGINQPDDNTAKGKAVKNSEWIDSDELVKKQSLYAFSLVELHQRKTKLIQMLEEVQRRYKHYCSQMKALVQTFEAVAGNGAAEAYSGMASRAMSRHFRCLKDAIVAQIKATKREIGEKDNSGAAPGTTKGETPRLRILDQTLRQQRAYQHMNMMESHPWRPQRGLPERAVSVLRAWLFEHFLHPYPSDVDKTILARQTGLSRSQVSNWFINARVRLWKPMVEEMYLEDLKEKQPTPTGALDRDAPDLHHDNHDQKPAHDPTIRIESGCLSSVVNNNSVVKSEGKEPNNKYHHPNGFSTVADAYGTVMQFDFSSYNNHHPTAAGNTSTALYGGGRGVSLTLGLHGGGGFSSASQSSLFLSREEMGECGTELYSSSLLDGENQGLVQYRNLMGAQFLHDLAG